MPTFTIEKFSAWTSGLESPEQWREFFSNKYFEPTDSNADVSFLPAMQRRRLSPLARAAFHVANQCIDENKPSPSIFCSIFGETQRTFSLVDCIAQKDDVSPMTFSLSVHNAISGQFTIFYNNTETTTAICPSDKGYLSAFAEAIGLLNEGAKSVLLVVYEENLPEFYHSSMKSVEQPTAMALLIKPPTADKENFILTHGTGSTETTLTKEVPALIELIRFFIQGEAELKQAGWQLNRQ